MIKDNYRESEQIEYNFQWSAASVGEFNRIFQEFPTRDSALDFWNAITRYSWIFSINPVRYIKQLMCYLHSQKTCNRKLRMRVARALDTREPRCR